MRSILSALFILMLSIPEKGNAQWTEVSSFNQVISDIHNFNGTLFIGGSFTKRNGQTCYWFTRYAGSFNDQTSIIGGSGVQRFETYNNDLWCTAHFSLGGYTGVFSWNGSSWEPEGYFNKSHTGIFADGSDIYVGSDFGIVSKKGSSGPFVAMPAMDDLTDNILAINKYNGDIIIAGDLNTYNAIAVNNIARWDGSDWQPLGDGMSGRIRCLAVYNSELFAGGSFSTAGGQSINSIAKWDGSSWTSVGGSATAGSSFNGVRDMVVHDNKLYVVGDFEEMGGISTKYVAVWDGNTWGSLSLDQSSNFANCIEVYNGKLYVGTFDFDTTHLYSRQIPTGIDDVFSTTQVLVYPNPAKDQISISLSQPSDAQIEVWNPQGQQVLQIQESGSDISLNTSSWPSGLFLVLIRNKESNQIVAWKNVIKM